MKKSVIKKKIAQKEAKEKKFKVGELCFCWYLTNTNAEDRHEIDMFYCKIVKLGEDYSTCDIYYGDEEDELKLRGRFNDVCTPDLKKIH